MKPRNIFLIRHGQSQSNADPSTHETIPDYKIELTDQGKNQAIKAGIQLRDIIQKSTEPFNIVPQTDVNYVMSNNRVAFYTSPYVRTRQTLRGIQCAFEDYQIERTREDPRLREQEWGHLRAAEINDKIDAERQAYGTFFYRIPDGESGADVYDRCSGFLDTFYRDVEKPRFPDTTVIVSHGFTIRVLLMRWLHWSVEEFHTLANPGNCAIFHLQLDTTFEGQGKYKLVTDFPKRDDRTTKHPDN